MRRLAHDPPRSLFLRLGSIRFSLGVRNVPVAKDSGLGPVSDLHSQSTMVPPHPWRAAEPNFRFDLPKGGTESIHHGIPTSGRSKLGVSPGVRPIRTLDTTHGQTLELDSLAFHHNLKFEVLRGPELGKPPQGTGVDLTYLVSELEGTRTLVVAGFLQP